MIDLHCHILPGLDDGARDMSEALEMARIAVADGISDIIATPHVGNGLFDSRPSEIFRAAENFRCRLAVHQLPLRVHCGAELHLGPETAALLETKQALGLGRGKFVLIELPLFDLPVFTNAVLGRILETGRVPVIAHPERYLAVQNNPDLLRRWSEQGVWSQVTAGALMGDWGRKIQKFSAYLVNNGLVHLVASDAHDSGARPPQLSRAYVSISRLLSEGAADGFRQRASLVLSRPPAEAGLTYLV